MPTPRLRPHDTALLIVDVQDRLMPTIVNGQQVINNSAILLRMADALKLPYLVTEQYPKGLGRTVEQVASSMTDQSRRIEKTRFSAMSPLLEEQLRSWKCGTLLVAGVEAHVCVLQTVLDLQASGRQCFLCTDAISASSQSQVGLAIARMHHAGAVSTGVIGAMYELMDDASHPAFRVCLELAKMVAS